MSIKINKSTKYLYVFAQGNAEGNAEMRDTLGGKGANLAEMCNHNYPVPSGVTISTEACVHYRTLSNEEKTTFTKRLAEKAYTTLVKMNKKPYMPLVSVRSGARVSMAGMMDTILNVGLTPSDFSSMFQVLGARTTLDSYRRLQQMYGETVLGIEPHLFSKALDSVKEKANVTLDEELSEDHLMTVIKNNNKVYTVCDHAELTLTYREQLAGAIQAVFDSWDNDRAKVYRKHHNIPEDWGTAVNIQFMVFGNAKGLSGSGVMFTRDTTTGAPKPQGEFLLNAQGEDVVAGVRTPEAISKLDTVIRTPLLKLAKSLEKHYNDVQDIEFTFEDGVLYLLQTRDAKRTSQAAIKIASEYVKGDKWDLTDLERKLKPEDFLGLDKPVLVPTKEHEVLAKGMGTGGIGSGSVVTNAKAGLAMAKGGKQFILWAKETTPNDLEAMLKATAIVTETGGHTCHAAVVARSLNLPCVVGTGTKWDGHAMVTVDADNGKVYSGLVPAKIEEEPEYVEELITYIADCNGLIKAGATIDGTLYTEVGTECDTSKSKRLVVDLTATEIPLSDADNSLLGALGMKPETYRDKVFTDNQNLQSFAWLNVLKQESKLPTKLITTSTNPESLSGMVGLILGTLGFKPSIDICTVDALMAHNAVGTINNKALTDIMGTTGLHYLLTKLKEDGRYPEEVLGVSSRTNILKTLKGDS